MPEFLRGIATQVQTQWNRLDTRQKITTSLAALLTLAGIVGLVLWTSRTQWTVLGNFEPAQAAQVRAALEKKGHAEGADFRLTNGGRTIEVSRAKHDKIVLDMGEAGLTDDAQIRGWSLFDQFDWTLTDREEQVRILRATTESIRRTVRAYSQVEDVQINAPFIEKQPLFRDEAVEKTVSVMLTLKPGATLTPEQIKAVRNTIAAAFPGVKSESVYMTDQFMNALEVEPAEGGTNVRQREVERETADGLEREIRKVLGRILGSDRISASVKIEFDWDAVKRNSEEYSSPGFEQLKVSEEQDHEQLRGTGIVPRGEPGVQSNVPTFNAQEGVGPVEYDRTTARINYLANKTATERIQSPYVKRLSAAVAIDGIWKEERDTATGESRFTYAERPDEEMKRYEELVKGILGENPDRQDRVVVQQVSYDRSREFARLSEDREREKWRRWSQFGFLAAAITAAALILVFQGYRARLRLKADEIHRARELERQKALAAAEAALVGEITIEEQERQEIIRKASDVAKSRPQLVAALLRTWLASEA